MSRRHRTTYEEAGVDIDAAGRALELIKRHARLTRRPEVIGNIGFFGGLFEPRGYAHPVLVSSTDGVGTKLKVAAALQKWDTVGIDIVNHCVNDILTTGAEPIFFLDYIATGKLRPEHIGDLVKGMAEACREVGCALIGGETAEMPGVYDEGDHEVVGFIVGMVERTAIIDGGSIEPGDAMVGLASSGLHTNGYSLVRKVFGLGGASSGRVLSQFSAQLGRTLGEELLEPHRCYYPLLRPYLPRIKGLAHITGGGLVDNIPRLLRPGLTAQVRLGTWDVPQVFRLIQQRGGIADSEMYRVFNMGLGMVLVCRADDAEGLMTSLPDARLVGQIVEGDVSFRFA